MINVIIIGILLLVVILYIGYKVYISFKSIDVYRKNRFSSIDATVDFVRNEIISLQKKDLSEVLLPEYERIERSKFRLKLERDLKNAGYGVKSSVAAVRSIVRSILKQNVSAEECDNLVQISPRFTTPIEQWEVLCYMLKKKGVKVIEYINSNYNWFEEKDLPDGRKRIEVTVEELDRVYRAEINEEDVTIEDKYEILTKYVYMRWKGFSIVDTLKELDSEGWEIGTSGSCKYLIEGDYTEEFKNTGSVWVQGFGNWSHFRFLQFRDEQEIQRVIQQISSKEGYTGLTEKNALKTTSDPSGSRIAACRPPVAESWGVFVRNFTKGLYEEKRLFYKYLKDGEPILLNVDLATKLLKYIMQSSTTTAFTGEQSSGKTSTMKCEVGNMPYRNIRVLEMSSELELREIYKDRNIMSMIPSPSITNDQIQDFFKKTDARYMIVGEVAQAEVTRNMIQASRLYDSTIFSHHGTTVPEMVEALADDLIKTGASTNKSLAVKEILSVVKLNVHMIRVNLGPKYGIQRVIGRISEVIPLPEEELKPVDYSKDTSYQLAAIKESFDESVRRQTQGRYTWHDILVFNPETRSYEATEHCFSKELVARMMQRFETADMRKDFAQFLRENWRI